MIPEAVKEWLEEQDAPVTIFLTAKKEIVIVLGEKPWELYRSSSGVPDLPHAPVVHLIEPEK